MIFWIIVIYCEVYFIWKILDHNIDKIIKILDNIAKKLEDK